MATKSFKDLIVWQRAGELTTEVYRVFSGNNDYGFRDQIQRASVSIMNNVAEGYARRSDKSFRQFLLIAKGSAAEVESMLVVARRLNYISETEERSLMQGADEVGRLLGGFIKKLSAEDS